MPVYTCIILISLHAIVVWSMNNCTCMYNIYKISIYYLDSVIIYHVSIYQQWNIIIVILLIKLNIKHAIN